MKRLFHIFIILIISAAGDFANSAGFKYQPPNGYELNEKASRVWTERELKLSNATPNGDGLYLYENKASQGKKAIILIQGVIPHTPGFSLTFDKMTRNRDDVWIIFNSVGGSTREAKEVMGRIQQLGRPHDGIVRPRPPTRVSALVPQGAICHSAATKIFLAVPNENRHISEGAALGVHASNDTDSNSWYEMGKWINAGLPRFLAEKIHAEGMFQPFSDYREISLEEIEEFQLAKIHPAPGNTQRLGSSPRITNTNSCTELFSLP